MKPFKPTFLYIKRHVPSGILYFGKTVKNPEKYRGSGLFWKRLLSKYPGDVENIWYCLFLDRDELTKFAIDFSNLNDIVESEYWANLMIEDGNHGAYVGHPSFITDYTIVSKKISEKLIERWKNPEYKERMIRVHKERFTDVMKKEYSERTKNLWTEDRKKSHSDKMKGRPGTKKMKGIPKTAEHNRKNSESLKGKLKSKEHCANLKESLKYRKVCRLCDKKIMSVSHFTRWLKSLVNQTP